MIARKGPAETDFQEQVVSLALLCGWLVYHTYDSRRSRKGFPDLVLVKPPRVIFAELKAADGRTTVEQREWLDALNRCPGVEAYLLRPADLERFRDALRRSTP